MGGVVSLIQKCKGQVELFFVAQRIVQNNSKRYEAIKE